MASTVISPNEVILNAVRYRVTEPVRRSLASIYPQKMVLGDYTKDSQTRASVITWNDFRKGGFTDRILDDADIGKLAYLSNVYTASRGIIVKKLRENLTGVVTGTGLPPIINELAGSIYAAWNGRTDVYKYDNTNDDWDTGATPTKLHDLPAAAVSALNFTHSGTEYIAFSCTTDYSYSSNGTVWTNDTTDVLYMAYWDEKLWGIDNTGQLWYSVTIGTEVNDAKLPLPAGSVKSLFVGPDASGEPILYAGTKTGLWAHDYDNTRWVKTALQYPEHAHGGEGACTWGQTGRIYLSVGMGVYEYSPTNQIVHPIGPDLGGDLGDLAGGYITQFEPTNTHLIGAATTGTKSSIIWFNGQGWSESYYTATHNEIDQYIHVSNSYSVYRLWVSYRATTTERIYYIKLPVTQSSPIQESLEYAVNGTLRLPWFDANQGEVDKVAIELRVEATDLSAVDTIIPSYRLNYSTGALTTLSEMTSAGIKLYPLPNSTAQSGIAFNSIQWQLLLGGSTVVTATPILRSFSMKYRKKIPARWGFRVEIDLSSEYKGNTPKQLANNLITAIESNTLVEFTYRDDTGATRVYYVDVTAVEGLDRTGHKEKGSVLLTLQEI